MNSIGDAISELAAQTARVRESLDGDAGRVPELLVRRIECLVSELRWELSEGAVTDA